MRKILEYTGVIVLFLIILYLINKDISKYETAPCEAFMNMETMGAPERCAHFREELK